MECFSNLLPKSNREYMNMLYDIDEDVCKEFIDIAKYSAGKIEEIEADDETDSRIDFFVPKELLENTKFAEIHIYYYRTHNGVRYTSNYLLVKDEEGLSLAIDLYKIDRWIDYEDLEEFVVDELMNFDRDYSWYQKGILERQLEKMKEICKTP